MAARQTLPTKPHCVQKTYLCAQSSEAAKRGIEQSRVSDRQGQKAPPVSRDLLQIGQLMGTAISTVSYEHEKLASEWEKRQDGVSPNGVYVVLALVVLIFLADIFFAYF